MFPGHNDVMIGLHSLVDRDDALEYICRAGGSNFRQMRIWTSDTPIISYEIRILSVNLLWKIIKGNLV